MGDTQHTVKEVSDVEPRTRSALEEYLIVLQEDGRIKSADDLLLVFSASQGEYTVYLWSSACECPDAIYNPNKDELCKHARPARFVLGRGAIPDEVLKAVEIEPNFSAFVDADEVCVAAPDSDIVKADKTNGFPALDTRRDEEEVDTTQLGAVDRNDDKKGDECERCAGLSGIRCFACYMDERGHTA